MIIMLFTLFPRICYADVTNGIVALWKFDDGSGTTAVDSSSLYGATAHNGTLDGTPAPTWTTSGKFNDALS